LVEPYRRFGGDALSVLLPHFALQHAVKMIQENQVELELHGTCQFLVYADGVVNVSGGKIHSIKKNTKGLIDVSKEVSLETIQKN
jgi:hypothetical protein